MRVLSLIKRQELNMDQNELKEIPAAFALLTNLKATLTRARLATTAYFCRVVLVKLRVVPSCGSVWPATETMDSVHLGD